MAATPNVLHNTSGTHIFWAVEATAGTRPTSAADYTELEQITSSPEMSSSPETIESTPLSETFRQHTAAGLASAFDPIEYQFNYSDESKTAWEDMVTASETAKAGGLKTWFCEANDNMTTADYFTGTPMKLGKPGREANSPDVISAYVVPTSDITSAAKPV